MIFASHVLALLGLAVAMPLLLGAAARLLFFSGSKNADHARAERRSAAEHEIREIEPDESVVPFPSVPPDDEYLTR